MTDKRYVIVGNGIAGTTCAETLRKLDPNCKITIVAAEPYPLYNRVALPRFLKGIVREEKVFMRTLEQHREKGIDLLTCTVAQHLDTNEQLLYLDNGQILPYDALLIATGGRPNKLPCEGGDLPFVFNFQTMDDTKNIIREATEGKSGVVVGGSFISYELAEGFAMRGLKTTWVMRGPRFLRRTLDEEGGAIVHELAREHGVEIIYQDEVEKIVSDDGVRGRVITKKGREIDVDIVGVGVGLTLNTDFLQGSPIRINRGVVVDEYLRTNINNVYAAGDIAEFYDVIIQSYNIMGTWDNALSQGRVAAINMAGGNEIYKEVPTYTSPLFNSNIAVIGATPEINPNLEYVVRADIDSKEYKKLFFIEDRLVGAITIGSPRGRKRMISMILAGEKIEGPRESLLDLK